MTRADRLEKAARQHLERLVAAWGLLSDFSFSDLLLVVKSEADDFVVIGQMRPTTSQTLFEQDLVGRPLEEPANALVEKSAVSGRIVHDELQSAVPGLVHSYECIPVRFHGEVLAVLCRVYSATTGRRTGGLERVYLELFGHLAQMVSDGVFPFESDDDPIEDAPRVGDGVIVLDRHQKITFASPNAVNALHRMGILSAIVGTPLSDLGVAREAVADAYTKKVPTIEEVERLGEVIVLFRCIPLINDEDVLGGAVLLRDVTDLRRRDRLLRSKDAAIREIHHRVKNNLQTISSLLRLQSRRLEDPSARDALYEADRRIRAIALVHEILSREPGEQVPFDEIVPALVELARHVDVSSAPPVEVRVTGDVGELVADVATPLAVVLAELLQNAVEHAFNERQGEGALVDVRFSNDGRMLVAEVHDNGSGLSPEFDLEHTKSLGLAIVRDLVRSQLGGSITMANDNGALVRLVVPLTEGERYALER